MRVLLLLVAVLLLLAGCAQIAQSALGELGTCMGKCQQLCGLAKNNSMDLGGYDVGLSKSSGGMKVSCSCMCPP
ncbi:MAG: hypothetical protein PHV13_00710 [Candidatus ainarchaeum sp.]|nr:hypothetical protein [Candidatus ainarchaeum sp.]